MPNEIVLASTATDLTLPQDTQEDAVIRMWLHGRPETTAEGYAIEIEKLRRFIPKPLKEICLADLQGFADSLEDAELKPASRRRTLAAVKSLYTFGHKLGFFPFDTARPLRLPKLSDSLADRIISEVEVQRMLAATRHPRNHVLLLLLYASGVRVSEISGLKWQQVTARNEGGQITVTGKGNRSRSILLPSSVFEQILSLRGDGPDNGPVFRSRKGGHLHPSQILRIVQTAAKNAGITRTVVVHSFRHAHISHSLDRGCPVHLAAQTCGHMSLQSVTRYAHARPNDSSARFLPL